VRRCRLGAVSRQLFDALAVHFAYGYLSARGDERVNLVNARHLFDGKVFGRTRVGRRTRRIV
jgi:hypothetical protein